MLLNMMKSASDRIFALLHDSIILMESPVTWMMLPTSYKSFVLYFFVDDPIPVCRYYFRHDILLQIFRRKPRPFRAESSQWFVPKGHKRSSDAREAFRRN